MKIVVLEGSPNKNGSSNLLADCFKQGAEEAGHSVDVVDTAHANIHPCIGCIHCGYEGPCVQKDDMEMFREKILSADMLVFVTPLYYYGMSAQLKTMIDRFCAFNSSIQRKHMKSALLTVAWNSDDWTFEALEVHYKTLVRYLNLEDMGMVLGYGCGTPSMTQHSKYPQQAYSLGNRLKYRQNGQAERLHAILLIREVFIVWKISHSATASKCLWRVSAYFKFRRILVSRWYGMLSPLVTA